MADQLSPEISLTTGLYKYITLYFSFILAVIIIPSFLDLGTFDVTIAFLLYIASIVILGVVIGMLILRNTLVPIWRPKNNVCYKCDLWNCRIFMDDFWWFDY